MYRALEMRTALCHALLGAVLFGPALPVSAQRAVVLVRHAELLGGQMASPESTPLSPQGEDRARRLSELLGKAGVTAIYTSDFARTQLTAAPLSKDANITPLIVNKADSTSLVERMRKEQRDGVVLVVGHSDTLPVLLRQLTDGAEVKIESQDFGNVFMVFPSPSAKPAWVVLRY